MRWEEVDSQTCSMARALAIFGDRWTLLIIRDAFRRIRRFSDFQKSLGINKHRLSDRLNRLVEAKILEKRAASDGGPHKEYRLTEKGIELYPVLLAVAQWGDKWECENDGPPLVFRHKSCGQLTRPRYTCSACNEEIDARSIIPEAGPGAAQA